MVVYTSVKKSGDRQHFEETESQLKVKWRHNFPTQPFEKNLKEFLFKFFEFIHLPIDPNSLCKNKRISTF